MYSFNIISIVLFLVGVDLVQCLEKPACVTANSTCGDCYNYLVYNVLKSDVNQYNMTRAFFPPHVPNPVSVVVYYDFPNETGNIDPSLQQVWFWTTSTFYLFQPQEVLQYTSLFFTDPSYLWQKLHLTLDMECADVIANNENYTQLLTQRLKLHTMDSSTIVPKISDDYNPKAHSAKTIFKSRNSNGKISDYLVSWKVVVPLIISAGFLVGISFFLFAKPYNYHKKVKTLSMSPNFKGWAMRTNMYIIMATSLVFSLYVVNMDITALDFRSRVRAEYKKWYRSNGTGEPIDELYNLVGAVSAIDIVTLIISSAIMIGMAIYNCCCCCKAGNGSQSKINGEAEGKGLLPKPLHCVITMKCCDTVIPWYFIAFPAVHLAAHSDQVIIGFIHTPYHATAVGILYGIIFVTCVALLKFISHLIFSCKPKMSHQRECLLLVPVFLVILILVVLIYVYFIAMYILLPINNAFNDGPNRILAIYQGIIVAFAAFLTWKVFKRKDKNDTQQKGDDSD